MCRTAPASACAPWCRAQTHTEAITMRIIADQNIAYAAEAFAEFGEVELVDGRALTADQLGTAGILLVRSVTKVDAGLLSGTKVRFVGTATAGTDHCDLDYLRQRGIEFADAPGCNARAVAEFVLACVLVHCLESGREPAELCAGIIGYGHVGTEVLARLTAIGMRCVVNDPPRAMTENLPSHVDLETALRADIVTLHVPLTAQGPYPTAGLLGAAELELVRPGALLLNAARGGVIDETALLARLNRAASPTIGIDCWSGEPRVAQDLLTRVRFATPHIAGHTVDARINATQMLQQSLATVLGRQPQWRAPSEGTSATPLALAAATPTAVLGEAVWQVCDPRRLTDQMRGLSALSAARAAARFDELRRQLGRRREFGCYRIACDGLGSDTVRTLAALGFMVDLSLINEQ